MDNYNVFAVFLLVVCSAICFAMYAFKANAEEIVEMREFSCADLRVSFKYPIFKGLESIREKQCEIKIAKTGENYTLIKVSIKVGKGALLIFAEEKNPQGIPYYVVHKGYYEVHFAIGDKAWGTGDIVVSVHRLPIKNGEVNGFSTNIFIENIIKSFTLQGVAVKK